MAAGSSLALLYGTKVGTKDWIAMPIGGGTGPDRLSQVLGEAGRLRQDPERSGRLPDAVPEAAEERPSRRLLARPRAGRRQRLFASWLLWTHNAYAGGREGQDRARLQGDDRGAEIRHRTAEDDDPRHAVVERRRQQQGLCSRPDRPDVQRRVDLLRAAELAGSEAAGDGGRHQPPGHRRSAYRRAGRSRPLR